jgi:pyruvate,water dikinase
VKQIQFDPKSLQVIMAGMEATWWLNDHLQAWLGEKNAADSLTQSVPNNVTAEMGLALLDVADAIRPHPEVVTYLRHLDERRAAETRSPAGFAGGGGGHLQSIKDEGFLNELPQLAGGREARDAILAWLDNYGMRGIGEIPYSNLPTGTPHPSRQHQPQP